MWTTIYFFVSDMLHPPFLNLKDVQILVVSICSEGETLMCLWYLPAFGWTEGIIFASEMLHSNSAPGLASSLHVRE